jgi:1-phosphatidylinositol-4-phosphate 5-kinase
MQGSEKEVLMNMMDDLIKHYEDNSSSLLARIYGIFTLKSTHFDPIDIIIMKNTAYSNKSNQKMCFDLKGSTKGRHTNLPDKRFSHKNFNQSKVLKDLNYMYINKSLNYKLLKLTGRDHKDLLETIEKDSKFLREHNLMDYSLLLVIEKISAEERSKLTLTKQNTERFRNSFISQEKEDRQTG